MSMADCKKCWDTPCLCGYAYRNWTKEQRQKLADVVLNPPYPPDTDVPEQATETARIRQAQYDLIAKRIPVQTNEFSQ